MKKEEEENKENKEREGEEEREGGDIVRVGGEEEDCLLKENFF